MQITPEQKTKLIELTEKMQSDILYTIENSDAQDIDELTDELENENSFDIEIIYYYKAMEYLMENDTSLTTSLELANDYGYELKNLSSETLASMLASQNEREEYDNIKYELAEILFPDDEHNENCTCPDCCSIS